jgi:hypothetical protein
MDKALGMMICEVIQINENSLGYSNLLVDRGSPYPLIEVIGAGELFNTVKQREWLKLGGYFVPHEARAYFDEWLRIRTYITGDKLGDKFEKYFVAKTCEKVYSEKVKDVLGE